MQNNNHQILNSMITVADAHIIRIKSALNYLEKNNYTHLTAENIKQFSDIDISMIELLTNRFAKLQDYLDAKIFFNVVPQNLVNN